MSPEIEKFIKLLEQELGYKEKSNGYTKFGKWYNTVDSEYDYSTLPWCDMFISWAAKKLGYEDWIGQFAWTPSHARWFEKQGAFGHEPVPGALVFFDWSGGKDIRGIDHVGVVTEVRGKKIVTIEGNIDGGVAKRKVRDQSKVVGYGYPEKVKERLERKIELRNPTTVASPLTDGAQPTGEPIAPVFPAPLVLPPEPEQEVAPTPEATAGPPPTVKASAPAPARTGQPRKGKHAKPPEPLSTTEGGHPLLGKERPDEKDNPAPQKTALVADEPLSAAHPLNIAPPDLGSPTLLAPALLAALAMLAHAKLRNLRVRLATGPATASVGTAERGGATERRPGRRRRKAGKRRAGRTPIIKTTITRPVLAAPAAETVTMPPSAAETPPATPSIVETPPTTPSTTELPVGAQVAPSVTELLPKRVPYRGRRRRECSIEETTTFVWDQKPRGRRHRTSRAMADHRAHRTHRTAWGGEDWFRPRVSHTATPRGQDRFQPRVSHTATPHGQDWFQPQISHTATSHGQDWFQPQISHTAAPQGQDWFRPSVPRGDDPLTGPIPAAVAHEPGPITGHRHARAADRVPDTRPRGRRHRAPLESSLVLAAPTYAEEQEFDWFGALTSPPTGRHHRR